MWVNLSASLGPSNDSVSSRLERVQLTSKNRENFTMNQCNNSIPTSDLTKGRSRASSKDPSPTLARFEVAHFRLTASQSPCREKDYHKKQTFSARTAGRARCRAVARRTSGPTRASRQDSSNTSARLVQITPTNPSGKRLNDFQRNFKTRKLRVATVRS